MNALREAKQSWIAQRQWEKEVELELLWDLRELEQRVEADFE